MGTFAIVAGCSVLFCSKGVVAKLAYRNGVDALTVLTLRMAFSLPFFGVMAFSGSRTRPLAGVEVAKLAGLGFLGYYLSSLVNFTGLQYVSVGLERIILYTYPSLVLVLSKLFFRKPVRGVVWLASIGAWVGIATAFAGELHNPLGSGKTAYGALLVFTSALTYAVFLILSGNMLQAIGAIRFTGIVVGFSCVFMIGQHMLVRPVGALLNLPAAVYAEGAVLALFGTVAPAILMSQGLKRAGAQNFAVISTIGPVTTLFLAWAVLGERPNAAQGLGFVLTLGSGLIVSLRKDPAREEAPVKSQNSGMPCCR